MELNLTDPTYILYMGGSGGNFLRHFLDPEIKSSNAKYWVDKAWHKNVGDGDETAYPYSKNSKIIFGDPIFGTDFSIGLGPVNYPEYIKVMVMLNTKNMHRSIDQIDDIVINIQITDIKLFTAPVSVLVSYNQLFDFNILSKLYLTVNGATVPDYKRQYFFDYKAQHDEVFDSWQYNVIERICLFEYNNNCVQHISGKMRNWSIDEIDEDNWQEFLEEKLCLTNYS